MTTRRELIVLLRTHPGITVNELAQELSMSVVGVRRHLDALVAAGLVEHVPASAWHERRGRPASGWRLSSEGMEQFPRRYDAFALELLEDLAEEAGPEVVEAVFARRTEKLVGQYEAALDGVEEPHERIRLLATLR
ncbi:MAG: helix-turn-helix transcriptional regulator, partial [Acidimicrobiales bacterium]